VSLALIAVLFVACARDASRWVGQPFAGLLFLDSGIVVSIGEAAWRSPELQRAEWARIVEVDGRPTPTGAAVHAAVAGASVGRELTYTLRRGSEVFRLGIRVRHFTWDDFNAVFSPMLGIGACIVLLAWLWLARCPERPELRALFALCMFLGIVLITGPDQYGPYRFTPLFYLALAAVPPAMGQLALAYPWTPGRWARRLTAAAYALFATLGVVLVASRFHPAIFLPLLYLVYCALANALLLYIASLLSALLSARRSAAELLLALGGALGSSTIGIVILVAYPLLGEPVSAAWLIVPIALMPALSGLAFRGPRRLVLGGAR